MKVRLEESGALGYLRCPEDGKTLLTFQGDDINLQDCEHYRWHLVDNDTDISDVINEKDNEEEEEEDSKEEEEEDSEDEDVDEKWKEVLKRNYIAAVSVEGGKFYLIHLEKAVKEG